MAGKLSPILSPIALFLLAGGLLLNIFILISGTSINVKPINLIYFLEAGPSSSTWTYWSQCTLSGSQNTACGSIHPAYPFSPADQGQTNVPTGITSSHNFYYYMSRVAWCFYLIASFFAAITLFSGIFACCSRVFGGLSGLNALMAVLSQAVCAALMTAWTVKARNAYRSAGQTAMLGRYAYGFTWAAFLCFFLAMILFCSSTAGRKKNKNTEEVDMEEHHHEQPPAVYEQQPARVYEPPVQQRVYEPPVVQQTVYEPPPQQPVYEQRPTEVIYDPQPIQNVDAPLAIPAQPTGTTGGFFNPNSKIRESGIKDEYS